MTLKKVPEIFDEIKSFCFGSKMSIVNKIPRPSFKANISMMNVEAYQPAYFSLEMGDIMAMM